MIFIIDRISNKEDQPIRGEALFKIFHHGELYWAVRLDTINDLIGFMKICGEDLIVSHDPVITEDGFTCYKITILDE